MGAPRSPMGRLPAQRLTYLTSLSICSSTSLSLKYVFHRLSGLGLRGCVLRKRTAVLGPARVPGTDSSGEA